MLQELLEILKYTLPAIVVLIACTLIVKRFLLQQTEQKRLAIFKQNANTTLQMRLQAYERLIIFLERMHPSSMISRYYTQGATAQDLQLAMVQGIRAEYEHNISQQLYVSAEVFESVKNVKEQMIAMLNRVGSTIPMGASSTDYIKDLTEFVLMEEKELPITDSLTMIHGEAKKIIQAE
jgi:hypothetical protein